MVKKKIVAILPSRVAYGKERSNIEVYHLLKDSGKYEITVLVSNKAEHRIYNLLEGLEVISLNFPDRHDKSVSILSYFANLPVINYKLLKIFKRLKPDILFVNSEISCYDLYWSLMRFKGKIVYRIGDAPAYPNLRFKPINAYMWKRLCVNKVDTFVFISKYIQGTVETTGRKYDKDTVIYNYPPSRKSQKIQKNNILPNKHKSNEIIFGYIGQITKQKGVDLFIEAALQLMDMGYACHVYVAGNLKYEMPFGEEIRKLAFGNDNITLLGEVEEIESFYNAIDVLCVPSVKQEPLGNILVEAKKYSRPCVIFPSGGMPELVTHKEDGYICKDKTEKALFEGMKWYLDNPNKIGAHKQASYDSIQKLGIDRASFEKKWLHVFDNL